MPLFGRRRRKLVFHASVTVHELRNVPLSGSIVIEAGLKQWRARMHRSWPAPIGADNVARWASTSFVENRVTLHVDATTNIVDSLVMKLRVKQTMPDSTKDKYIGKAKLDLGEFAGNNKTTRLYLLEKSKVNSGLLVTVEMKQISGDPMFKCRAMPDGVLVKRPSGTFGSTMEGATDEGMAVSASQARTGDLLLGWSHSGSFDQDYTTTTSGATPQLVASAGGGTTSAAAAGSGGSSSVGGGGGLSVPPLVTSSGGGGGGGVGAGAGGGRANGSGGGAGGGAGIMGASTGFGPRATTPAARLTSRPPTITPMHRHSHSTGTPRHFDDASIDLAAVTSAPPATNQHLRTSSATATDVVDDLLREFHNDLAIEAAAATAAAAAASADSMPGVGYASS